MPRLLTPMLLALLIPFSSHSQITYGKEECGTVYDSWIKALNEIKAGCADWITSVAYSQLRTWIYNAHTQVSQSHLRILQNNEGEGSVLISVINTLHNT